MSILSSRHRRWAVPAAVAVTAGAVAGGTMVAASAEPKLPPRTAAQLLVDLQTARVDGLSGTVVQNADLGLPALPVPGGGQGSSDLTSLVSGSHTLRVWLAGEDKARVALLGTLGESDVIHNGRDVWTWSSTDNTATHIVLPEPGDATAEAQPGNPGHPGRDGNPGHSGRDGTASPRHHSPSVTATPLTPQEAAQRTLEAIDPSTRVTTDGTARVAGRAAYELVLAPKDTRSLVGQVRLAVDADTHVPLRVQVTAKGQTEPAFEVAFTHVSFSRPGDQNFTFTPPPGATVKEQSAEDLVLDTHARGDVAEPTATTVGTGWTKVVVVKGVHLAAPNGTRSDGKGDQRRLEQMLASLPHVSGTWGSGRLLRSDLFTALLTDDGRLVAGFVEPDLVYQAAAQR